MNLSLGIVGLPNVGKSTLFNALTKQNVLAANYPFATIDPNVGIVAVADKRVQQISDIAKPEKIIPAVVEFVDIAGLVKGAATGAGLGNKFLSHIKEVSAIVQVVRAFQDTNITHVENTVDPKRDIELIQTELGLKDIDTLTTRIHAIKSRARFDKLLTAELEHLELLLKHVEEGNLAFDLEKPKDEEVAMSRKSLFLLTDKPVIYLVNSDDPNAGEEIKKIVGKKTVIVMDVKTESELMGLDDADRLEFMKEFGLSETGLDRLTNAAYETLGLISFFTEGPEEVRAWTIVRDSKAPVAGAVIHTDFQTKFIACDVCYYQDYIELGGWEKAKLAGKVRLEGKEYVVQDGDIMVFRHG